MCKGCLLQWLSSRLAMGLQEEHTVSHRLLSKQKFWLESILLLAVAQYKPCVAL